MVNVSVGVVESGELKSLTSTEPLIGSWIKCHSNLTHWLRAMEFVDVVVLAPI